MANFSHAIEATETAYNSAGSAARENAKYMESLEAKTTNLSATFQKLANDIISKELVGSVLDLTNKLVGLADTGIGRVLTQAGLFAGAGFGLSQLNAVTKFLPTIISQFSNFAGVLLTTQTGLLSAGEAFSVFGGFAGTALPILLAVGVAIFGIVEAVKAYQAAHPDLETLGQQFKDEKEAIDDTKKSLQEAKNDLDKLNNTPVSDRSSHWIEETERLKNLCSYYEYLLQMQEQEAQESANQYREADKSIGFTASGAGMSNAGVDLVTKYRSQGNEEAALALGKTYASESEAVFTLANAFDLVTDKTASAEEAIADLKNQLYNLGIQIDELTVSAEEYNNQQVNLINEFLQQTNGIQDLTLSQREQQQELLNNNQTMYEAILMSDSLTASDIALKEAYEQLAIAFASSNGVIVDTDQVLANLANTLGVSIVQAAGILGGNIVVTLSHFQQLADGTWVVVDALGNVDSAANDAADSINGLAGASYTGSDAAFQMAQNLLNAANQVDTTSRAFYDLVAQEIIFNNTGIDVSQQIAALQALASQAGIAADAIASVTNPGASIARAGQSSGYVSQIDEDGNLVTKKIDQNASKQWALQQYYQNLMAQTPQGSAPTYTPPPTSSGGGSVKKAKDEIEKDAQSTLNNISSMTSQTIDDAAKEAQEKAKKTLEAIKKAVKEFYDERINALKEQNEEIDKQVQLEEKLKALEEAKNKQILLYENGEYHYGQDLGAIASAQKDYDKFVADMERDEQIGVLEDTRDKILKVLEQIESNLENYTETQLSSIGNLSTSVTSSIENITNIIGDTSSGIFAALQGLLSGIDASGSGGSLDLSSLFNMLGGSSGGTSVGGISGGGFDGMMFHNQLRNNPQEMLELALRNKLMSERQWKKGQLLSLAYQADTDIPLDVQWWMSMFEAEMSDQIRGGTGNIGAGDPRGLDPDASKHVDIQYWLDAITNAKDLYEAMDYYARAEAAGYVLAEFADGYFDALGYKNFDPKTIKQDMRNAYKQLYVKNKEAVLMTRFKQYYSPLDLMESYAQESAWYFNQNNLLSDLFSSQLTAEQVWKYGGDMAINPKNAEGTPLSEADPEIQKHMEEIAARNRQYLLDELDKQIQANSEAWFDASDAEREALHSANEYYRAYKNQLESGNYEGLGGWLPSAASPYIQGILHGENGKETRFDSMFDYINSPGKSYTGDVVMIRNGEVIAPAEDVIPEIAESLGIPTDYGTTTGVAAQGSILEDLGSNGTTNYNINIDNVELPGVVDSNGFITGLRNLAYQYAYTRQ